MREKIVFFTGFPGFIGTRIVEKLINDNQNIKIYALVIKSAYKQAQNTISKRSIPKKKIELLIGDITQPKLGLDDENYTELSKKVTDIFHLAAIYDMEVPKNLAWNVNVRGTIKMVKFALACPNLFALVYFSSTIAAGVVKGDVLEDKLDFNCTFHFNHYETTKFAAETYIRRFLNKLPIVIIRPGSVVGDSITGETDKFDGFYYPFPFIPILKMFPIWLTNTTMHVPMVPVDYIVNATTYAADTEKCHGHCFQLGEFSLSTNQFLAYICGKDDTGTKLRIPSKLMDIFIGMPFFRYIFLLKPIKLLMKKGINFPAELMGAMDSYNYCNYRSDNRKLLEEGGIKLPKFKDYAKNIVAFYKKNKKNTAIRRKRFY